MSRSVNKAILVGSLGKDADTKFTTNGSAKSTFSIATSQRWKDKQSGEWKEETTWHNIVAWNSEKLSNYLVKGTQVYIEGRISNRSFEGNDGVKKYISEVVADNVMLLGGKSQESAAPRTQAASDDDVPW